jgi:hypothetical protein
MLVGWDRAKEIVINVALPLAMLYARIFKDRSVRETCLLILNMDVSLPLNSVVNCITENLFQKKELHRTIQSYQGIIHLARTYCINGNCADCEIQIKQQKKG